MADPHVLRALDRRPAAAVAGAMAALVLGGSSIVSLVALMPFVDVRPIHLSWASDALLISLSLFPVAAMLLSRFSPLIVGTRRAVIVLALTIAGSSLWVTVLHTLPRSEPVMDLEPAELVAIGVETLVRLCSPFALITAAIAGVVWSLQVDRLRRDEERRAERVQRRLTRRGREAVRRHVQPRFLVRAIEDVAGRLADGERPLLRLARHLRLLQQTAGGRITVGDELRILRSMARVMPRLTVEARVDDAVESLEIGRSLAAAAGELLARDDEPLHVRIESEGATRLRVQGLGEEKVIKLEERRPPAGPPSPGPAGGRHSSVSHDLLGRMMARLPLAAILISGLSLNLLRSHDANVDGSRLLALLLWCVAAPLLAFLTSRMSDRHLVRSLLLLGVASMAMAAGVCVTSVILFRRWSGLPAQAGIEPWAMVTDESAFLATAVAATVFVLRGGVRLQEARSRTARLRTLLAHSETTAVESSFHPHFLFNALNSVAGLAREDPQAATQMLLRLAALFRLNIESEGEQLATVAAECDLADLYLSIQRMRFGDRLRVAWDVPAALRKAVVPRLVLQTFVENAVKHGIARLPSGGMIAIVIRRRWQRLVCRIVNDVPPGESETIVHRGGLSYATARLALLYGSDVRWQFLRGARSAFAVQLEIPYRVITKA